VARLPAVLVMVALAVILLMVLAQLPVLTQHSLQLRQLLSRLNEQALGPATQSALPGGGDGVAAQLLARHRIAAILDGLAVQPLDYSDLIAQVSQAWPDGPVAAKVLNDDLVWLQHHEIVSRCRASLGGASEARTVYELTDRRWSLWQTLRALGQHAEYQAGLREDGPSR
jgi:DNA-binding HxlR family transcriptional regulator